MTSKNMTLEQFTFWLEGYLQDKITLSETGMREVKDRMSKIHTTSITLTSVPTREFNLNIETPLHRGSTTFDGRLNCEAR